ncbi:MAG: hypothetical protein ACLQU4_08070 [Limisphaerales bacterium]
MKTVHTATGDKNFQEESTPDGPIEATDVDFLMLEDSLAMTPWERILANDDIVNFGDTLRAAMEQRNAKSR